MWPILFSFHIGDFRVALPGYGTFLAIGFSVALYFIVKRAKYEGLDPEEFLNASMYVILAALIGSRLFHVLVEEPSYYWEHPAESIKIWRGGYTFYGGLISAGLVLIWYLKKVKLPLFKSLDIFATYTALGSVFGRLGCFASGCCHGKVCEYLFFPVSYVAQDPASFSRPLGVPLYATQIWQASGNLLVFLLLLWVRQKKKFDGQLLALYFMAYPVVRMIVEVFRGDEERGFVIPGMLTTSQLIGLFAIPLGLYTYRYAAQRKIS